MSIEERQREEKEQRRQSIIDAAGRVLRGKDVGALTMADIAKEARLSRSLLYVYFEDLDDIVLAVTLHAFEALHRRFVKAAAAHETGLLQIRAIGEAYVQFAREEPAYFDLITRFEARTMDSEETSPEETSSGDTFPEGSASHKAQCLAVSDHVIQAITDIVQTGIDDGSIRSSLDPLQTAITLWGYTHGLIQLSAHKGPMLDRRHGITPDALVANGLDFASTALVGQCNVPATRVPPEALG